MMNILLTDCNGTTTNVMVFIPEDFRGRIGAPLLKAVLEHRGFKCLEAYEVPQREMQYYLFEPCWFDRKVCENTIKLYNQLRTQTPDTK